MFMTHEKPPTRYINPYKLFVNAPLPLWLLEMEELSAGAKLTYARLALFAGQTGIAWCRQDALANALRISDRQVRRNLDELVGLGLIEIERGGANKVNHYRFLWQPIIEIVNINHNPYRAGIDPDVVVPLP